ncbi:MULTISPECIES: VOC family protein [Pseudomonas]|jgi:predicted enzyme related to lactoylglutathione lyase|uniref:Drug:proton antiporter n=2 Tax=Pseudomonas TaxID=286 RepID=A0A4Y9TMC3_PSEFL|nr:MULTISPECIES: VOC family protein [Pseudomonas]CRM89733.1 putative enzyme related to lactoylglutathione lyase [Pseudomonas sp. 22 E 5]MCX9149787.1 VOC family protein [Pseudomonas sp. TB1-B1]QXH66105.1 VOC family protein [Pseudomonas asgharzadehiana]TFW45404.1 drug:proton antiporter [Pseudomonas fluorescens]TKJ66043.1 drug:proton antiporter [Pseudomonas sp. CFBP13506]
MNTLAHYFLLYVDSPATSANFYSRLLGKPPVELNPTFALFILDNGVKLGLWSRHTVQPAATATGGGGEVGFALADTAAVRALHDQWVERGAPILQSPTAVDFGYTFVAQDPDGHRLRAFSLND